MAGVFLAAGPAALEALLEFGTSLTQVWTELFCAERFSRGPWCPPKVLPCGSPLLAPCQLPVLTAPTPLPRPSHTPPHLHLHRRAGPSAALHSGLPERPPEEEL